MNTYAFCNYFGWLYLNLLLYFAVQNPEGMAVTDTFDSIEKVYCFLFNGGKKQFL